MVMAIRHRGPDDEGIWTDPEGRLVLGHCRLAIIDLTQEGHQPMTSSCGRYVISFNGEIYNYLELRHELENIGVQFHGHSDTEVLLSAVSQWGIYETLNKVIGMFAFALWDNFKVKLILSRDRAGKKPLYYLCHHNSIYFASEIKAFKTLDEVDLPTDYNSIYQYLTFGYIPAPATIYKNVSEIPAAHYMTIDQNLNLECKPYWQVEWIKKRQVTFDEAVEETDRLLNEAIKIRLRADVSVGCFLSGGIDSGLLAAMASLQMNKKLKTFTVSFKDGTFNESPLANMVSKRYETDHHEICLSPDIIDIIPKVVKSFDEPFADPSAIPSYCISGKASEYLKVVLNGEGADEIFAGYRRHWAMKYFGYFKEVFNIVPDKFWIKFSESFPQPKAFRSKYSFFHRFTRGITENPFNRYITWCTDGFNELEKANLYKETTNNGYCSSIDLLKDKYGTLENLYPLDHFRAMDFLQNMHDDMLVKMDIATMAHGLEGRNPFLDHRIVEWGTSLPAGIMMKGLNTKPILRELAKKYLPREVVIAPKRGFEIPLVMWLHKDLYSIVRETCLAANGIILELFDRNYVEKLLDKKLDLDPNRWAKRVWILFMLAMWEDQVCRESF
jgi:asparagine synthase (glutamine-hydrolysing)